MLMFTPTQDKLCFNVSFPDDTEYEIDEAIRIVISSADNRLKPGRIANTTIVITDNDSKQYTVLLIINVIIL